MNIIVCVDNRMGVMFNNRRQSRDKILCRKVLELAQNNRLLLNSYSAVLFDGSDKDIIVDDEFLKNAENGDFCFVEGNDIAPYVSKTEKLIVFRWNRDYPYDYRLDIDLCSGWKLIDSEDFKGSSHDKITMEVYVR